MTDAITKAVEALKHVRNNSHHPDQLVDEALAALTALQEQPAPESIVRLIDGLEALSDPDAPRSRAWEVESAGAMAQAVRVLSALQPSPALHCSRRNTMTALRDAITKAVEALTKCDQAFGIMSRGAFHSGLEGTKEWDNIAGAADMYGAQRDAVDALAALSALQPSPAREEAEALVKEHIELNMSNYTEDEVSRLNQFGINAYVFIAREILGERS